MKRDNKFCLQKQRDGYMALVDKVRLIDPSAAEYMTSRELADLEDVSPYPAIGGCFAWSDTRQGHRYWLNIEHQLMGITL